ncbi:MAG: patatin-like phospholipase family protein [Bacteroidales bacterium]|jgi:NTE family protein|nr:patatin-like phospholipase family protein [Bacteroidales bacterium]
MKQKVALVLGSGGARGSAHIGVIRELLSQGFEISSISGSSMGALIGGVYASGKLDEYEEWLCNLDRMDVFSLVDFTLSTNGIIKADKVLKEIKKFIPNQKIEDLPIPFTAVATDIRNKKEKVFSSGNLWEAIRASISIPFVLTPTKIDDLHFVDGGVLNPVPVNQVKRVQGDILVAVNVNAQIPMYTIGKIDKNPGKIDQLTNGRLKSFREKLAQLIPANKNDSIGYFQLMTDTTSLMLSQISKLTLELNPPDLLIDISRYACGTFDFHKAKEVVEIGKVVTSECIKNFNENRKRQ